MSTTTPVPAVSGRLGSRADLSKSPVASCTGSATSPLSQPVPQRPVYKSVYRSSLWPAAYCTPWPAVVGASRCRPP